MNVKLVKISELDRNYQTRFALNADTVEEYAEAMKAGEKFPPVTVVGNRLTDGYHRVAAAEMLGMKEIEAEIIEGDEKVALSFALSANLKHGLRRTNDDKRQALKLAWENRDLLFTEFLGQDENGKPNGLPSARQLSDITGVSKSSCATFIEESKVSKLDTPSPANPSPHTKPVGSAPRADRFGVVIPERILPAFKSKALKEHLSIIGKSRQAMDRLRLEDPSCVAIDQNTMIRYDNLIRQMRMSSVYCVCRACGGVGCYRCSKRGFQTKAQYSMNPPEMKGKKKPSGI